MMSAHEHHECTNPCQQTDVVFFIPWLEYPCMLEVLVLQGFQILYNVTK